MPGQPLHRRVASLLEDRIHSGEYAIGARIPSERELSALFGVSRITTRHAIGELVRRGLLLRRQGQGTFVAQPRVESSLLGYFRFTDALRMQGLLVSTRVHTQQVEPAPAPIADELEIAWSSPVLRLVRLRIVDGEPFALEASFLPLERLPGIERAAFATRSLYEVLESDYGTHPVRARETLEPVCLEEEEARLLGVERACALSLRRTTYDLRDRPVEVGQALIPGPRCRLLVELWSSNRAHAAGATATIREQRAPAS